MSAPAEVSRRRIIREAFFDWLKAHAQLAPGQTLEDATDDLMTDVGVTPVMEMVIAERALQIEKGFDAAHDDQHDCGELTWAAAAYLRHGQMQNSGVALREPPTSWPFKKVEWHPRDSAIGNLIVSIAQQIAEVERLMRLEGKLQWEVTEPTPRSSKAAAEQGNLLL